MESRSVAFDNTLSSKYIVPVPLSHQQRKNDPLVGHNSFYRHLVDGEGQGITTIW